MANPQYVTLVAATVSTLTLDVSTYDTIEVSIAAASASSDPVYFTLDGTTPAVATNGSHFVGGAAGAALERQNVGASTSVKLKSAGTPTVCVTGIN